MPIYLEWGNPEKTILFQYVRGEWTLADTYAMLDDCETMLAAVPHCVDIIADLTHSRFSSGNLLSALSRIHHAHPRNIGLVVAVNADGYLRALAEAGEKLWPGSTENIRYAGSLEAAYTLLAEKNASI